LSFRSAGWWREESAVSLLAASRFLADKAGFGMTRTVFLRKLHHDQSLNRKARKEIREESEEIMDTEAGIDLL
jgi:hypothetical protein